MDELKIISGFTSKLLSKIFRGIIQKKIGCDLGLSLREVKATVSDGKAKVHLDLDLEIGEEELMNLIHKFNLD